MTVTIADVTPRRALEQFHEHLGLTDADVATAFGVSPRTLTRWRNGDAYPQHNARARMNELLTLSQLLEDIFDSTSAAQIWMHAESLYLGGLTPAQAVRAGRVDRALASLEALESGIYL